MIRRKRMKKYHSFGRFAIPALLVILLAGITPGCSSPASGGGDPVLQSIAVTTAPTKTTYVQGETLDLSGLVVTGTYSDGTTKAETVGLSDISGYDADTTGQQTLTVTVNGKTAFFTVTVNPGSGPVLQGIAVTTAPTKTAYEQGEALDLSGLVVTGTYSDGTTKTETVTLSNISGYSANTAGQQTLTVTVGGKTATFAVTVNAATLQSIAVTTAPAKTAYTAGEALDLSGLAVTGTYSDGATKAETVTLSDISGYSANTVGQQTLTVTVGGKTATFTVTVSAATLQSIAVTTAPAKTTYEQGETLDLSGLAVTGTYSDGTTKAETVGLSNISGYNAGTAGQQTLTVTVGGKTASFTVTVNAATLQSIAITSPPAKTIYVVGEALDPSGLAVTGTYSNGTTRAETVTLSNISGYNAGTAGQQTLTVTVGGKTANFTVTVKISGGFIVNLEDPINGIPANIVLSKSGASKTVDLTIAETYDEYAWRLNDAATPVSTGAVYTLDAADCRLGTNYLTVEVKTTGGVYNAREITFTVNQ
jgi:hypothetical protein